MPNYQCKCKICGEKFLVTAPSARVVSHQMNCDDFKKWHRCPILIDPHAIGGPKEASLLQVTSQPIVHVDGSGGKCKCPTSSGACPLGKVRVGGYNAVLGQFETSVYCVESELRAAGIPVMVDPDPRAVAAFDASDDELIPITCKNAAGEVIGTAYIGSDFLHNGGPEFVTMLPNNVIVQAEPSLGGDIDVADYRPEDQRLELPPTINDTADTITLDTIEAALKIGWAIESNGRLSNANDKSTSWGAHWKPFQYAGQTLHVPHWLPRRIADLEAEGDMPVIQTQDQGNRIAAKVSRYDIGYEQGAHDTIMTWLSGKVQTQALRNLDARVQSRINQQSTGEQDAPHKV